MHTSDKGQITEAVVLAQLVKLGVAVLLPFGSNHRYDLVVDAQGDFVRLQAKTGALREGKIIFNASSINAHRGKVSRSYTDEADYFAVYCPETDLIYWVPVEADMSEKPYLRVDPPRNGQTKGVRLACDYITCPFGDSG